MADVQQGFAVISPCGQYRYWLERQCRGSGTTCIVMVNPSTADAEQDDHTIRKLRGFGDQHGWGRLIVVNLFAFRATDVRELRTATNPIGVQNDHHIVEAFAACDRIVCAWGPISKQPAQYREDRWRRVHDLALSARTPCFSIGEPAKCGHPKHPLMLPYSSPILEWSAP